MTHKRSVYQQLFGDQSRGGALFFLLIDPDKVDPANVPDFILSADTSGVDAFLVGGSLSMSMHFEDTLRAIKSTTAKPVLIFPGGVHHVSKEADAILFLSMISGRNPEHLIGQHVVAAPIIKNLGLEPISTGYMVVESGSITTAEFMSNSKPLPRGKPEIAAAHGLAAEMLGMSMLYLEAGSGAAQPVPVEMVRAVSESVEIPIAVGGGIRSPQQVAERVKAGASVIVVGNHFESRKHHGDLETFVEAAHNPHFGYSVAI